MPPEADHWQLLKTLFRRTARLPAKDRSSILHFLARRDPRLAEELRTLLTQDEPAVDHLHTVVTLNFYGYILDESNSELGRLLRAVRAIRLARRLRQHAKASHCPKP